LKRSNKNIIRGLGILIIENWKKIYNNSSNAETILLAGLLMSRRQQKNMVEVTIDDMVCLLVATTDDVRNQISIALDQMVMLEIESQKRGRQII
jgi:hypothetical protein